MVGKSAGAEANMECVGIGAGPSNLSFSCLLKPIARFEHVLLERRKTCAWHEGLLLDGTTVQVPFLKDLVTLADPTSRYSFLCFLQQHGRLYQYINAAFTATLRTEWSAYLQWVCDQLGTTQFDNEVREVRFDGDFVVCTETQRFRAGNVVLGSGLRPAIPAIARPHLCDTVFHASEYRGARPRLSGRRVVVIGGGQSGAEVLLDVLQATDGTRPASCVWISRRSGFLPLDASPFTNELFTPSYSEYFFSLPAAMRRRIVDEQRLASDGISQHTLTQLYQQLYVCRNLRKDKGPSPLLQPNRELVALRRLPTGWNLETRHADCGVIETLSADIVILATGYEFVLPEYLDSLKDRLHTVGSELAIDEDFRVSWDGPDTHGLYIQNASRLQRGIADPNLSLIAWRSGRIVNAIAGQKIYTLPEAPPLVMWSASCREVAELCA